MINPFTPSTLWARGTRIMGKLSDLPALTSHCLRRRKEAFTAVLQPASETKGRAFIGSWLPSIEAGGTVKERRALSRESE